MVTLKRKRGLYFWSILICAWGLSLRQLGYVLKFMVPKCPYLLGDILAQGGWVAMVTGFSMVLYSCLNLILDSRTLRRRVLWMIIINAAIFHPLMITISIGSNVIRKGDGKGDLRKWAQANMPSERIQIVVFSGQETLISLFYVRAAYQYLKGRFADKEKTQRAMFLLLAVQIFIVAIGAYARLFLACGVADWTSNARYCPDCHRLCWVSATQTFHPLLCLFHQAGTRIRCSQSVSC